MRGGSALIVLGLWLGVVGYGITYAGVQKLGPDPSCTLGKAFRNQCKPASGGQGGGEEGGPFGRPLSQYGYGRTIQQNRLALNQKQYAFVARQPLIPVGTVPGFRR